MTGKRGLWRATEPHGDSVFVPRSVASTLRRSLK
jgi:hypothetical protein